ncbi:hypothetical protein ACIP93_32425 [Streptomyces sp. NPDC088745]|uniref:hypothetical protein n=1 Tax=Streptomyces sp. NPDC088745 TaxID=3365884 RepID=UPI0038039F1A
MSVTFFADFTDEPVNMANANAARVLDVLGYGYDELCGDAEAEDFLGRVLVALAVAPADAGRPATVDGNVIDCGRPAGYTQTRLEELRELAEDACARRLRVAWG